MNKCAGLENLLSLLCKSLILKNCCAGRSIVVVYSVWDRAVRVRFSAPRMINVEIKSESGDMWVFGVEIDEMKYEATTDREYWEKLTGGKIEPSELVRKSFEFLLERESKEAILKKFNLQVISTYFPEYEKEMVAK